MSGAPRRARDLAQIIRRDPVFGGPLEWHRLTECANGFKVATLRTDDFGWETALILDLPESDRPAFGNLEKKYRSDWSSPAPVERYKTKRAAVAGHKRWVRRASHLGGLNARVVKLQTLLVPWDLCLWKGGQ